MMTARTQAAPGREKVEPKSRATEMDLRVRRALWLVVSMLSLSLLLVLLGVYITTRSESLNLSGYISGVILTLGSFLGLLGLCLEENRRQLLTAAIVFLSLGVMGSFLCVVIDGACVVFNMDMRPLKADRCQYYSGGSSYVYENFYTSVTCWSPMESCNMTVRSGTCYCCDLYDCANGGYLNNYYEYVGVKSCEEVFTLYVLIWILASLNLVAFFAGILTTAVLGSVKHLRSISSVSESSESAASSPTAPLLMDTNTHTAHRLYPVIESSMFFPPSSPPHPESPHPSSPPLPYRVNGLSA
ncbi:transmembrane protein 255B isoform X1 [Gymnodraco acuticeps]|uniref:Transmembrane protein 255B isoform X1 n=1 Tax=Gymnodraco acuticeps TaxID=8218 RepID=A0A6P8V413_GYMAC|nr:transmembrane protein 255B isoform X1 [Gymnodraco acuticeps]